MTGCNGKEPQFNKEDVWAVAEYIVDGWHVNSSDGPDFCSYCDVSFNWKTPHDQVKHLPTCVVLKARDLLTGKPK